MVIYRTVPDSGTVPDFSYVCCDVCGSFDIAETTSGYVCKECGVELEVQKLQYDRPYNADLIQYASGIGATQIGTKKERVISPHSRTLTRLSKYNHIVDYDKIAYGKAAKELSRVLSRLGLGDYTAIKEKALANFKEIRPQLRPGSKYRNIEKLVAIILYFRFRLDGISIILADFFSNTELTKKEFNEFFMQIRVYYPEYVERDRKFYISQRILEVCECFELGMPFYHLSKKLLHKLWEVVKGTTDDVLAGLVCSISGLCAFNDKISVNTICKRLGIRMSTIQAQVKKKILQHFKVDGFVSLVRSSNLLRGVVERLGLLENKENYPQKDTEEPDMVEINLGNTVPMFSSNNQLDYYWFALKGEKHSQVNVCCKINHNPLDYSLINSSEIIPDNLIDFQLIKYKYSTSKDPPLISD
ncbi:MAG: hypothetical protein ACFFFT_00235 [Candidatus Thorarchaeota archaeon]